jgi:hypothetical protein
MAVSDLSLEDIYGPPEAKAPPPPPASPSLSPRQAAQQAVDLPVLERLESLREAGTDPRSVYPQEPGFLFGKKDVFPYELEQKFSPKVREFVRRYYGPAEIQYDPEGSLLGNLWTRVFGSAPTEEEKKQIATAQDLIKRGSGSASETYKRTIQESLKGAPSAGQIAGEIPKDLAPFLQKSAKVGRRIELPKTEAKVALRDLGIVQPSVKDQKILERARIASVSLNQLEQISPGLSQHTLGPILAADFNAHYGVENAISADSLNIRQIPINGVPKIVFDHPESGKPTFFDPAKFELRDIAELLPELMVIGGDIGGMILGTSIGAAAGPKTAIAGNILGGAYGAFYGRMKSLKHALERNAYVYDTSLGGFVKDGWNDEKGEPRVVPLVDLMAKSVPDALWSLGGNIVIRSVIKLGKLALFGATHADALKGGLSTDQFLRAVADYKDTTLAQTSRSGEQLVEGPWGPSLARTPNNDPTSVVLQKIGEDLQEKARIGTDLSQAQKTALFEEGAQYLRQAEILRQGEPGTAVATARDTLTEKARRQAEAEGKVTGAEIVGADSNVVARALTEGLPITATREVSRRVNKILEENNASMNEVDNIISKGEIHSAADLGELLVNKSKAIMGDPTGTGTGLYAVFKQVETALSKSRKDIPYKPFNIAPVEKLVNKLEKSSGAIRVFQQTFKADWRNMVKNLTTASGEKAGTLNVTYKQISDLLKSIRYEVGSGHLSQPQVDAYKRVLGELEKIQVRGLKVIDDAGGTTYSKQIESANKQIKRLPEIWQRGLTQGLQAGKYAEIAGRLFKDAADPDFIRHFMTTIKPGKKELEMLRNTLLYRYKQRMEGRARGELQVGTDIAGQRVSVKLTKAQDDAVTVTQANQAAHETFYRENESWIKTLFKDKEWARLTDEVTNIEQQAADLKKVQLFDENLRKNPIFAGSKLASINDDLAKVIVHDPVRLLDDLMEMAPGPRKLAFIDLYKAIGGLPKLERSIIVQNLRGALFRKLQRPDMQMAESRGDALAAFDIGKGSLEELKRNSTIYDMVFGEGHRKTLETIFKDINTLSVTGSASVMGGLLGKGTPTPRMARIPMAALKVYVGVLNRKARALTQAQKIQGAELEQKFQAALLDADKAAKLVKMRNMSQNSKLFYNALGQILGIETGEAIDAVNTFGIDFDRYPGVKKSNIYLEAVQ